METREKRSSTDMTIDIRSSREIGSRKAEEWRSAEYMAASPEQRSSRSSKAKAKQRSKTCLPVWVERSFNNNSNAQE